MSTVDPQGWAVCVCVCVCALRVTYPCSDHDTGFRLPTQRQWDDDPPCTLPSNYTPVESTVFPDGRAYLLWGFWNQLATLQGQWTFWSIMFSLVSMMTYAPRVGHELYWTMRTFLCRRDCSSCSAMDTSSILGKTFLVLWFIFSSSPPIWTRGFRERERKRLKWP